MMDIIFLGSGTGSPNPDRAPAAALVRVGGRKVLFDFGPGILRRLVQEGQDHRSLDAVCLTHFHPDHTLDLWAWLFALSYEPPFDQDRPISTALVADKTFRVVFEGLKLAYGRDVQPLPGRLDQVLLDREALPKKLSLPQLSGVELSPTPAEHRPESLAFLLEHQGLSLVYSGDTGWSEDLVELARGADCLILEATKPDRTPAPGHLTPAQAGRLARRAGVKRLVLSHLSAAHGASDPAEAARAEFSGPVAAARDGLRIHLQPPVSAAGSGLNTNRFASVSSSESNRGGL